MPLTVPVPNLEFVRFRLDKGQQANAPSSGEAKEASALRRRSDGGLDSEVGGQPGSDVYYVGVIDILQASGFSIDHLDRPL